MNCLHRRRGAEVIMKKPSDHEIFIMKIYIHVIFSNFTKTLNHENLELYGTPTDLLSFSPFPQILSLDETLSHQTQKQRYNLFWF